MSSVPPVTAVPTPPSGVPATVPGLLPANHADGVSFVPPVTAVPTAPASGVPVVPGPLPGANQGRVSSVPPVTAVPTTPASGVPVVPAPLPANQAGVSSVPPVTAVPTPPASGVPATVPGLLPANHADGVSFVPPVTAVPTAPASGVPVVPGSLPGANQGRVSSVPPVTAAPTTPASGVPVVPAPCALPANQAGVSSVPPVTAVPTPPASGVPATVASSLLAAVPGTTFFARDPVPTPVPATAYTVPGQVGLSKAGAKAAARPCLQRLAPLDAAAACPGRFVSMLGHSGSFHQDNKLFEDLSPSGATAAALDREAPATDTKAPKRRNTKQVGPNDKGLDVVCFLGM